MAEHAAAREAADGLRVLDLPQRASCLGQEEETGVGQNHGGPFAPVEEGGAERGLELLDLRAHRRLGDMQAVGRLAEVQLLGDGGEVTELPDVEHETPAS
jgi:hypothetical protein